jgi:thioester reductase-like protein
MADDVYRDLASKISVIYHDAADVNMVVPYSALRAVNALGTHEVLRFAVSERRKRLHYISAISVFPLGVAGTLRESDPLGPVEKLSTPYGQTKWVAEKLVEQAAAFGMETRIYRPGQITGHSVSGASNERDLMFDLIHSLATTRSTLDLRRSIDLTPVDYVAGAIVHLAEFANTAPRVYHLCNGRRITWTEFVEYFDAFGYSIHIKNFDAWQGNLKQRATAGDSQSGRMAMLSDIPTSDMLSTDLPTFDATNTQAALEGSGIDCHPPTMELVHRYLSYFIKTGAIPAPQNGRHAAQVPVTTR